MEEERGGREQSREKVQLNKNNSAFFFCKNEAEV